KARATEHQSDVVIEHIGRNSTPEQLHGRSLAIGGIDARTAEFEDFPPVGDERRDVVFVRRIEAAETPRRLPPKQPIGSDDCASAIRAAVVENNKMIAVIVEAIEIAPPPKHLGQRPRSQRFVKYPITQGLRR